MQDFFCSDVTQLKLRLPVINIQLHVHPLKENSAYACLPIIVCERMAPDSLPELA